MDVVGPIPGEGNTSEHVPPLCPPHKYRLVHLSAVVYKDGSSITPSHKACARCGKVKRRSFDF